MSDNKTLPNVLSVSFFAQGWHSGATSSGIFFLENTPENREMMEKGFHSKEIYCHELDGKHSSVEAIISFEDDFIESIEMWSETNNDEVMVEAVMGVLANLSLDNLDRQVYLDFDLGIKSNLKVEHKTTYYFYGVALC